MHLLINLLVVVAAMGAIGSVRADQARSPGMPATAHPGSHFASEVSASYSVADVVNLPAGAEYRRVARGTFGRAPDMTSVDLSDVADSVPVADAGTNAGGSLLDAVSALNVTVDDLSAGVVPGDFPASRSGSSAPAAGARFPFSIAEMPDPTDWMTLLCGLAVVAFMARRKSDSFSD